ncbi:hypothetical protein A2662_01960 [Candidatus Giovannonibacteria bacterium RIFCSPHIGHO2_01_FULL_45_33]|nr:MAG: hypothetical protein A2662_01960 [Candidatus Giovannonibacteria bacterium RIFCSPHIGHO2_01_FULL_45_33]
MSSRGEANFKILRSATGTSRAIFQQKNTRVLKIATARERHGFIALITSIILSVILLVVTIALNQTGFLTRGEVLESEYKNRSIALAEGCADMAIIRLALDPAYSGNESSVAVGSDTCAIGTVQQDMPVSGQATINTSAVFPATSVTNQGAVTKITAVINSADLTVVSWVENP